MRRTVSISSSSSFRRVLPSVMTWPAARRMRSQKDSALSAPIWPKEEERDVAKLDAVGVLGNDLEVERAHVEAHQVGDEVERLVLGQVRVLVAPWPNGLPIALAPASPPTSFTSLMKTSNSARTPLDSCVRWRSGASSTCRREADGVREARWGERGAAGRGVAHHRALGTRVAVSRARLWWEV